MQAVSLHAKILLDQLANLFKLREKMFEPLYVLLDKSQVTLVLAELLLLCLLFEKVS